MGVAQASVIIILRNADAKPAPPIFEKFFNAMKLHDQHEQLKYKFHLSLLYLLCRHTDECADNDPSQRHASILNDFWSEKYYNAFLGKQSLYLQLSKRLSTEHMTQLCMAVAIQLYRKPAFVNGNGYCRAVISVPSYRYKAYPKRLFFFQTPISVAQKQQPAQLTREIPQQLCVSLSVFKY